MYYLITPENFSRLHRLKCDEMWHFYAGDPVDLVIIGNREIDRKILGNQDFKVQIPQVLVPKNHWQGAMLREGGEWALIGTNAFPGYSQDDFELCEKISKLDLELSQELVDEVAKYL